MRKAEEMERSRDKELKFLDVVSDVTAEIELANLLQKQWEACHMLNADRATLFLNDTSDGVFRVMMEIVFVRYGFPIMRELRASLQTRETINIPHAYADDLTQASTANRLFH